ncbi:MAG: 3-deoxy-7-phosphoheptulonate synthase class II [Gammaproteobacteria bacterium]|jgi:3-deoxy-7-phosphoheptulonate synthase|nr:3-deoxy-7-phosphoheptulonate synthase class II [Gammaproteobacteria bacterium]
MSEASHSAAWAPDSWRSCTVAQIPAYRNASDSNAVMDALARLPPLVTSWEIEALREQIALAQNGKAFILQGGDCAETFADCNSAAIVTKLKILLQMSVAIISGIKLPVVRVGRIAGQYAKPRSADTEVRNGVSLPSYRGDIINRNAYTAEDREPDPHLMLRAYERSALTLNFIRALIDGGFADLHHPENWDLDWVRHSPLADEYRRMVQTVADGLDFFESLTGKSIDQARRVDFYTAHEGLHLPYEQAQTRFLAHRQKWYDLTTHFPWIGARTSQPGSAHIEFFRGIANPVGIKLGVDMNPDWLRSILRSLNPANEPGRLTLIHRLGASRIRSLLPPLIETVQKAGVRVLWVCDPMHGNTETASNGMKTRRFDNILDELAGAFEVHRDCGTWLGGVHLELTGEHVTECTGGARGLTDADLHRDYRSQVDPRLNYEQAMEVAMRIAGHGRQRARR